MAIELSEKDAVAKIRPIGDYILIEVMERNRSAAGLILPHKEKTECLYGKVIAVGPGEHSPRTGEYFPICIKVGDILMSVQYMGEKVVALGKKYRLLREHGVWAKLKIDYKSEGDWDITELAPYRDHITVKMDSEEKNLKGNLFLPSNPQVMFRMASVVSSGPGPRDKNTGVTSEMHLSAGDRVIVLRYAGCIVKVKGTEYRVASFEDVQGIMDGGVADILADPTAHPVAGDNYDVIPDSHLDELNRKTIMDSGGN